MKIKMKIKIKIPNLPVFSAKTGSIGFNINDPYENRTRVTAVKGRCLSLLTNGPYKFLSVPRI